LQVTHAIQVGKEARLAIIATLDDVLGDMSEVESWQAGHGGFRAGRSPVFLPSRSRSVGSYHDVSSESAL
jgi:hypothetical protein